MEFVELYLAVMSVPIGIAVTFNIGNLIIRSMLGAMFSGWLRF